MSISFKSVVVKHPVIVSCRNVETNHKTRSNLRGENDWGGGRSDRVVPVFYLILIQPDQRSKEQNYEFYVTTNACFDSSYNIVPKLDDDGQKCLGTPTFPKDAAVIFVRQSMKRRRI